MKIFFQIFTGLVLGCFLVGISLAVLALFMGCTTLPEPSTPRPLPPTQPTATVPARVH